MNHELPARRGARGWPAAAFCLLLCGAYAHWLYLTQNCPLDLAGDEAHYWEWSRRLDLSYYSKGPLVAYIIAASRAALADWSQSQVGSEALAVRLPAMLLAICTGWGIYVLTCNVFRERKTACAATALTFTMPILVAGSILMTIDVPLAAAWTWALICCERGLRTQSIVPWLVAGVLIALGILAKYTMVLLFPVVGLAILFEPRYRPYLRRPGPWLAVVVGCLGFAPILIWNARHDWVSFRHVAGQAGLAGGTKFDPLGPFAYLGGQAAVVNAAWFVGMIWAAVELYRRPRMEDERHDPAALRLLLLAMLVPWVAFLAFSFKTKIQPNWPVLALIGGTPILAAWLDRRLRHGRREERRPALALIAIGVVLGVTGVVLAHRADWLMPAFQWLTRNAPPWELTPAAKYDPTARLRGWAELGAATVQVLETERAAGREPFILTDDYQVASEIAFYCPERPPVYCIQAALGSRLSQYDLWTNPIRDAELFVGRPCIYVGGLKPELIGEGGAPPVLPDLRLARTVEHQVRGVPIQVWSIHVCPRFAGFPDDVRRIQPKY